VIPAVTRRRSSGAYVQSVYVAPGNSTSLTITGVTAGNTLVGFILGANTDPSVSGTPTTDSQSGTVQWAGSYHDTSLGNYYACFYIFGALSGSHTLQWTASAGSWAAFEISGVTAFDQFTGTKLQSVNGPISVSLTPPVTAVLLGVCLQNGGLSNEALSDPPTGFIHAFANQNAANGSVGEGCYKITGSAATASWSWTDAASVHADAVLVSFK